MQKLLDHFTIQTEIAAGTSCTLEPPWSLQPVQGRADKATIGLKSTDAINPVYCWDFGSSSLTGLQFTVYVERSAIPMGGCLAPLAYDVTGEVNLGRGTYSLQVGRKAMARAWMQVTAIGATRTVYCLVSLFGDFAPQRAAADVSDGLGHGFDAYRSLPNVFSSIPNRHPTRAEQLAETADPTALLQSPKVDRFTDFGETP